MSNNSSYLALETVFRPAAAAAMGAERPLLRGGCCCGRNRYAVQIPAQFLSRDARILFNSHPSHRLAQASPLTAFLRIPLTWYQSATVAYFPDETPSAIRRSYTSPFEPDYRRQFCGFCGTPLSFWSEQPRSEAEYIQVTLGSLSAGDLADLEDMGLFPESLDEESEEEEVVVSPAMDDGVDDPVVVIGGGTGSVSRRAGRDVVGALPWFDSLVEGSRLGNMRNTRGTRKSRDGSVRVEWEVVEWTGDDCEEVSKELPRKRKRDEGVASVLEGQVEGSDL